MGVYFGSDYVTFFRSFSVCSRTKAEGSEHLIQRCTIVMVHVSLHVLYTIDSTFILAIIIIVRNDGTQHTAIITQFVSLFFSPSLFYPGLDWHSLLPSKSFPINNVIWLSGKSHIHFNCCMLSRSEIKHLGLGQCYFKRNNLNLYFWGCTQLPEFLKLLSLYHSLHWAWLLRLIQHSFFRLSRLSPCRVGQSSYLHCVPLCPRFHPESSVCSLCTSPFVCWDLHQLTNSHFLFVFLNLVQYMLHFVFKAYIFDTFLFILSQISLCISDFACILFAFSSEHVI